jgi:hypothetical protein
MKWMMTSVENLLRISSSPEILTKSYIVLYVTRHQNNRQSNDRTGGQTSKKLASVLGSHLTLPEAKCDKSSDSSEVL